MKKRVLSMLLVLAMVITMFPMAARSVKADTKIGHFEYIPNYQDNYVEYLDLKLQDDGRYTITIGNQDLEGTLMEDVSRLCIINYYVTNMDGKVIGNYQWDDQVTPVPKEWTASTPNYVLTPGETYLIYCMGIDADDDILDDPVGYEFTVPNTLTFSFDANGGTGTMAPVILPFDDATFVKSFVFPAIGYLAPEGKDFDQWEWRYEDESTWYTATPGSNPYFVKNVVIRPTWKDSDTIKLFKIELNDFPTEFTDQMIGYAIMDLINDTYTIPEDAHHDKGNRNVYIKQGGDSLYEEKPVAGKATTLTLEVYAEEGYDFDPGDLSAIEVWINGVKRGDVEVVGYNDYWNSVDLIIPATVVPYAGEKHTLTFESNGGSALASQEIMHDGYAVEPEEPTKTNQSFTGWYKDPECTIQFNFLSNKITEDTTLYAGWEDLVEAEYIQKIEINNFPVVFTDAMIGNEAVNQIIDYQITEASHCSTNAAWIKQNDEYMYGETLIAGADSKVLIDIYADPYVMNHKNPPYDFDKGNLDKIEVWINGEKRSDVQVTAYNENWRGVYLYIPVEVAHATPETTVVKQATLTEKGKKETRCTTCGALIKSKTIHAASTIKLAKTAYVYNTEVQQPSVIIKNAYGTTISSDNYKITYSKGCKLVGKYYVKVVFNGDYTGSKTLSYTIRPQATKLGTLTARTKSFIVKWTRKTAQVNGYEIQYSTSSAFAKKYTETATVTSAKTTSKTIKDLKAKKKYYVRIRTYKTVNGKTYYSTWSAKKAITTK